MNKRFVIKSIVALTVLMGCVLSYAEDAVGVKDVFAALSDISKIATDAQSDKAVAENAGNTNTDIDSIRDAVAAALTEAQALAENILAALNNNEQDAAESAYELLLDALQKARDAYAGKLVTTTQGNEEVNTGVVTKSDATNTGGTTQSTGQVNIHKNLSDPDFLQAFQQRQKDIYQLATAFGGDDRKNLKVTPD